MIVSETFCSADLFGVASRNALVARRIAANRAEAGADRDARTMARDGGHDCRKSKRWRLGRAYGSWGRARRE